MKDKSIEERLNHLREIGIDLHLEPENTPAERPGMQWAQHFVRTGAGLPPLSPMLFSPREKMLWLTAFVKGFGYKP